MAVYALSQHSRGRGGQQMSQEGKLTQRKGLSTARVNIYSRITEIIKVMTQLCGSEGCGCREAYLKMCI